MTPRIAMLVLVVAATEACSGTARGLEAYRSDTQNLLASRDAQIKSCYDDALKSDDKLAGTVTIRFVVEKKTGELSGATVDAAKSTAPKPLGDCVLTAMKGLKLVPPDKNEGRASFVYEFKPTPAGPAS